MKSHSDKNTKQPKLRFPGFTGEWQEKRLGDLIEFMPTNSYSRENLNSVAGTVKNIHYGDIHKKFPLVVDVKNSEIPYLNSDIDIEKYPEQAYCKDGDLIIADASEDYADIGKAIELTNVGNEKVLAGLHTFLARDTNKFAPRFKSYLLSGPQAKTKLKMLAQGISVLSISKTNLKEMDVTIPTLPEQKRIADFLSDIDTKIEKLTHKKELTEQYKKGAMQKIFSQKIRFKDENGKNYPSWEEKRLGDVAEYIQTNSFSRECMNYNAGQVQNIHYGDIHVRYPSILNVKTALIPFLNEDINIEKYNNSNFCQNGDIIFADASEDTKDIGKCIEITNMSKEKILAGLHTIHIRLKAKMAIGYNGYYLSSPCVKDQVMKLAQGISVFGISKKAISELVIMMPVFEEQTKIADFLLNLDKTIEQVENELAMLKEFKKGLLQGMFV